MQYRSLLSSMQFFNADNFRAYCAALFLCFTCSHQNLRKLQVPAWPLTIMDYILRDTAQQALRGPQHLCRGPQCSRKSRKSEIFVTTIYVDILSQMRPRALFYKLLCTSFQAHEYDPANSGYPILRIYVPYQNGPYSFITIFIVRPFISYRSRYGRMVRFVGL